MISEMNPKQVMEEAEEKLAVQKRGKRKGGRKKKIYEKDGSEEIFCTGLVSIRKEKGDDTLPAGE